MFSVFHATLLQFARHYNLLLIRNHSSILTIHKDRIFWKKNILENKIMVFQNGLKSMQAGAYNGLRKLYIQLQKRFKCLYVVQFFWPIIYSNLCYNPEQQLTKLICKQSADQALIESNGTGGLAYHDLRLARPQRHVSLGGLQPGTISITSTPAPSILVSWCGGLSIYGGHTCPSCHYQEGEPPYANPTYGRYWINNKRWTWTGDCLCCLRRQI